MVIRLFRMPFVALLAGNWKVLSEERVSDRGMFGYSECRRLESIHGMTAPAVTSIGASQKLTVVLVFMTVRTFGAFQWCAEICRLVAHRAREAGMLSGQRIFRFRVIEVRRERKLCDMPACRDMTARTRRFESAAVRILVTSDAISEIVSSERGGNTPARTGLMTTTAGNSQVRSGQRKSRDGMVESQGGPPGSLRMT
jgi:hypothetical protein